MLFIIEANYCKYFLQQREKDAHCGPHNWVDVVFSLEGAVDGVLKEKKKKASEYLVSSDARENILSDL